jgi:hypothetical protein
MNWEFIGATGEWVGAIAVVATLFYLGRQIHQQNRTARYTAWQTLVREFIEHNDIYLGDTETISLRRRGYESPDSLSPEERDRWDLLVRQAYNIALLTWQAHEEKVITDDHWAQWARWYSREFDSPGGRFWRENNLDSFPEFWRAIDEHAGEPASKLLIGDPRLS